MTFVFQLLEENFVEKKQLILLKSRVSMEKTNPSFSPEKLRNIYIYICICNYSPENLYTQCLKSLNKVVKVRVTQLCPTLCDPMDYRPPSFSVHGILQARIQEWLDHSFLQGIFQTQESNTSLQNYRQILYHLSHQVAKSFFQ